MWKEVSGECGEEVLGKCGKGCRVSLRGVAKRGWGCRRVCGLPPHFPLPPHTVLHSSNTLSHTRHTYPINYFTPPPTLPTSSIFSPYLTHLPKLPKIRQCLHHPYSPNFSILPPFFPILPHTYFIIYPIPTFLIYCQISQAIKKAYTRNFL